MRKFLFLILLFRAVSCFSQAVESAMGVVQRRIPTVAPNVTFVSIADSLGYDVFEIEASAGKVTVKGSSPVAMCRGLYDYLKTECKCLITWEADQLNLPSPLPDSKLRRVVTSAKYRQYFNVVTFSYTTAFWDWERWEKEIDWMALHGINMPLSMNGQEKIWQQLWSEYGCTATDMNAFFCGPGFLPFNRMGLVYGKEGCLSQLNGTLPQSFIDNDALLQKKIISREAELGMKPVIPGFSGFIPRAIKRLYPNVRTWVPTPWNFATPSTLALHPLDTMFSSLTNKFIKLYKSYYGDVSNFYLIDMFNEIDPPAGTTLKDLGIISKNTYNSLIAADPKATWVIQGWCFYYQSYWRNTSNTSAFLDSVPNDKMIVLDLNADSEETFRLHPNSIGKKSFIWCKLGNNWGQHTQLYGNLDVLSTKPIVALRDANATETHMVGMGLQDEGIEQNSVCFELMTDNMWRKSSVNLPQWINSWAQQRYGTTDAVATQIWSKMYSLFYKNANDPIAAYQITPNVGKITKTSPNQNVRDLLELMINAPEQIQNNLSFQRDLVDVTKRFVGDNIQTSIWKVVTALQTKNLNSNMYRAEFDSLMLGLDALLGTQQPHRLDNWIYMARNTVSSIADKNLLEQNARVQLTTWVAPSWQGYARKEWSGVVGDYYRKKWNLFFDQIASGNFNQGTYDTNINAWANTWCNATILTPTYKCRVLPQTKYLLMLTDKMYASIPKIVGDSLGIAYGKPVSAVTYNNDPIYSPETITDGNTSGLFWAASPYPQSATIDLQSDNTITLLRVYPYFDGVRYYKYKIEGSRDNNTWFMLADMSTNTSKGSALGFRHVVNSLEARFVRITFLSNSANPAVHLHELRVFGIANQSVNTQPDFSDTFISLLKNMNNGDFVRKVIAVDADTEQSLQYSIVNSDPVNAFVLKNDSIFISNANTLKNTDEAAHLYLKAVDNGLPQMANFARYTISLDKVPQNIVFPILPEQNESSTFIVLPAYSTSGLEIRYSSSDPAIASVRKDTLFIHKSGDITITAEQPGSIVYAAAVALNQQLHVNRSSSGLKYLTSANVSCYPNPANNNLIIVCSSSLKPIEILDISSVKHTIRHLRFSPLGWVCDISDLKQGFYFVILKDTFGNRECLKFEKK